MKDFVSLQEEKLQLFNNKTKLAYYKKKNNNIPL